MSDVIASYCLTRDEMLALVDRTWRAALGLVEDGTTCLEPVLAVGCKGNGPLRHVAVPLTEWPDDPDEQGRYLQQAGEYLFGRGTLPSGAVLAACGFYEDRPSAAPATHDAIPSCPQAFLTISGRSLDPDLAIFFHAPLTRDPEGMIQLGSLDEQSPGLALSPVVHVYKGYLRAMDRSAAGRN